MGSSGGMGTTGQDWPTWAKVLVWLLLLSPLVFVVFLVTIAGQTAGSIAIENGSVSAMVVKVHGVRDHSFSTEFFAVPPGSRVILGRDGLFPRELDLMTPDCAGTVAIYELDTYSEGGSVKIAPDGTISREPGGVPWFGDDAVPATCPT